MEIFKMENINLKIKNFGPINEADININDINIIAGENASGKSLSSKLLFCFLTSMSDRGKYIENKGIFESFSMFVKRWADSSPEKIRYESQDLKTELNSLMSLWRRDENSYEFFIDFYTKFEKIIGNYGLLDDKICRNHLDLIKQGIEIHKNQSAYLNRVINFLLLSEFETSSLISFRGSKIKFKSNLFDFKLDFQIKSVNLNCSAEDVDKLKLSNVIYIDNIQTLDFRVENTKPYHFLSLMENLTSNQGNISKALQNVYLPNSKKFEDKLIKLMGGFFEFDDVKNQFRFKFEDNDYDMADTASGYKQIGIFQLLLSNKSISHGTWLIIDEPEVYLHPSMQMELAKLLIEIAKELNVKIYINTQSPFIIESMEVYSLTEKMEDKISFFFGENNADGKFNICEIERQNLNKVYDDLARPYNVLNSLRFQTEWDSEFG